MDAHVRASLLRASRGGALSLARAPEWRNWHTRSAQNRLPSRACGFESHLRHRDAARAGRGSGDERSGGLRGAVLGRGAGAVVFAGADRALLLDVPLLVEAVEGDGDQDDLQQGEDDDEEADQRDRDQAVFEAATCRGRTSCRRRPRRGSRGSSRGRRRPAGCRGSSAGRGRRRTRRAGRRSGSRSPCPVPPDISEKPVIATMTAMIEVAASRMTVTIFVVTDSAFSRFGRQSSYPGLTSPTLTPTIIESRSDDAAFSAR